VCTQWERGGRSSSHTRNYRPAPQEDGSGGLRERRVGDDDFFCLFGVHVFTAIAVLWNCAWWVGLFCFPSSLDTVKSASVFGGDVGVGRHFFCLGVA